MKEQIKKTEQSREELVKKLTESLKQVDEQLNTKQIIEDNKVIFEFKKEKYRIRKPNFKERQELRKKRNKKYLELLKDDDYVLKEELIEQLKFKGVNIESLDRKINELQSEIENLQVRVTPIKDKKVQNELLDEITKLKNEQTFISTKITDYLAPTIENELFEFENLYNTYLTLEKESDGEWKKAYGSFDELMDNADDTLILTAIYNSNLLNFNQNYALPEDE